MANSGIVLAISGVVKAIANDGTERMLQVGDRVSANEQILTGDTGTIAIEFSDGSNMDLGRNTNVTLNDEIFHSGRSQSVVDAQDEVAAIQQALLEGESFDPSKLAAPAAGIATVEDEVADDAGISIVDVKYLAPDATPYSGFATTGINVDFFEQNEELILNFQQEESKEIVLPNASNDSLSNVATNNPVTVAVTGNDSDTDGNLDLSSVAIVGADASTGELVVDGEGTWSVNGTTGDITFTPETGFTADPTAISYTINDNDGNQSNQATVTIDYAISAPVTANVEASDIEDSAGVKITLTANDDGSVDHFVINNLPSNGTLMLGDTILISGDIVTATGNTADVTFIPNSHWSGDTDFDYVSVDNDGNVDSTVATASITITPVADAPTLIINVANETATDHIVNGSFENLNVTRAWGHFNSDKIDGWDSDSDIEIWDHVGRFKASEGKQHMELDYARDVDSVSQTMNMTEGQYTLTFDAANRGKMSPSNPSNDFSVLWNNQVVVAIKGSEISNGASGIWETFSFQVDAVTGLNTLTFIETEQGNNTLGPLLDNIKLVDYSYDLTINAALTDTSESLSDVLIPVSSLNGATIQEVTGIVSLEGNNYKVIVSDGIDTSIKLMSAVALNESDINAIKGSVTSSEISESKVLDSETTIETALHEIDGGIGNDILTGSSGDDMIFGNAGNDTLTGGNGDDVLDGGAGQDTFIWTSGNSGEDTVLDFNENEDVLQLADLLAGTGNGIEGVDHDGHLQLKIGHVDGDGHVNAPSQTIDLNTVSAGVNPADTLNSLLTAGAINDGV